VRRRTKWIVIALFAIIAFLAVKPITEYLHQPTPAAGQNPEDQVGYERRRILVPEKLVELINPKPGSMVLDLGAGYGLFSFPLGRAVGKDGKVFATDIDWKVINYLRRRAKQDGARNVIPVMVKAEGIDPFYRRQTFDLILAADVVALIDRPEPFFRELHRTLKDETSRLWILDWRFDPDFTELEFESSEALRRVLQSAGCQDRIGRFLRSETKQALAGSAAPTTAASFTTLVIEDLNRLLENPALWPTAKAENWPLKAANSRAWHILIAMLEKQHVFSSGVVDKTTRRPLRLLNRLIILDRLGTVDLWHKKAQILSQLDEEQLDPLLAPLADSALAAYASMLQKAGYALVREHNANPYCHVWEFKRAP
jgi:ubiquinone/menaquinone biosynthesis C-methylase UbiE